MSAVLAEQQQAVAVDVAADEHALAALPEKINAAVCEANDHASAAMQAALRAGELLTHAKAQVEHGQWEIWLTTHCTVAVRTAQAFMRLHRQWKELSPENRNAVALLPLRKALAAITTDPSPRRRTASIIYGKGDEKVRLANALDDACSRVSYFRRGVLGLSRLKRAEVEAARNALQAALEVIDKLLAEGQA